jgi:hypothetical protein
MRPPPTAKVTYFKPVSDQALRDRMFAMLKKTEHYKTELKRIREITKTARQECRDGLLNYCPGFKAEALSAGDYYFASIGGDLDGEPYVEGMGFDISQFFRGKDLKAEVSESFPKPLALVQLKPGDVILVTTGRLKYKEKGGTFSPGF